MGRVCSKPGCWHLAESGKTRCEEHPSKPRWYPNKPRGESQRKYDRTRPSPRARGYTTKWDKARKAFIAKHTACAVEGCNEPATDVDHIRPWKVDGKEDWKLFWDRNNWQPLCHSHHSRKTRRESKRNQAANESGRDPIPPC